MTEHIIQFGVEIDDDAIIKSVEGAAEKQIIRDIEKAVLDKIFVAKYYSSRSALSEDVYTGKLKVDRNAEFSEFAQAVIRGAVDQYKEDIINMAAEMLADSYKRTKAWKEAAGAAVDGVKE